MKGLIAQNTLVLQIEKQIESRLKEGVRDPFMRIVVSGMKVAMKGGPDSILAKLKGSQDPVNDIVKGAIGVLGLLRRAAKGTMPIDAMIPAGMVLVLQALDFAERAGMLKIDKATIDQATHAYMETLLPMLGITPEKMAQYAGQVNKLTQDPEKMSQLQRPQPPSQLGAQ